MRDGAEVRKVTIVTIAIETCMNAEKLSMGDSSEAAGIGHDVRCGRAAGECIPAGDSANGIPEGFRGQSERLTWVAAQQRSRLERGADD